MKPFVIITADEGIIDDPVLFASLGAALAYFEKEVRGVGFRKREPGESADDYVTAFQDWANDEDLVDWEIHFYNPITIRK